MKTMKIDWRVLVNNPTTVMAISRGGRLVTRVEVLQAESAMRPKVLRVTFADGHRSILNVESWGWGSESGYKNDVVEMLVTPGADLEAGKPSPRVEEYKKNLRKPSPMVVRHHH